MKTCVLTGATGSVGLGIATRFLEEFEEIELILTCRNLQKGREVLLELQNYRKGAQQIKILTMDLSDPKGILQSVDRLHQMVSSIDFLVLNAGVMVTEGIDLVKGTKNLFTRPSWVAKTGGDIMTQTKGKVTSDDLGFVFCSNLFGHYLMVTECLDLLEKSEIGARVMWSSSTTAQPEFFDFDDYQCKKGYCN
jgi:3-keto steroid reductase